MAGSPPVLAAGQGVCIGGVPLLTLLSATPLPCGVAGRLCALLRAQRERGTETDRETGRQTDRDRQTDIDRHRELMAPRTDRTTRISSAVASPLTTNHAAKRSVFVTVKTPAT